MSTESIRLTFSDDGEFLQLSRLDAAVLLTWILGGDHDEKPTPADDFDVPAFGTENEEAQAEEFVPKSVIDMVESLWTENEPQEENGTTQPPAISLPIPLPVVERETVQQNPLTSPSAGPAPVRLEPISLPPSPEVAAPVAKEPAGQEPVVDPERPWKEVDEPPMPSFPTLPLKP